MKGDKVLHSCNGCKQGECAAICQALTRTETDLLRWIRFPPLKDPSNPLPSTWKTVYGLNKTKHFYYSRESSSIKTTNFVSVHTDLCAALSSTQAKHVKS